MGRMSKRKGAAGEREAAEKLNEVLGTRFHRGRQYHGGPESPDLAGDLPGLHLEVKRCERLRLYEALTQARQDASVTQVPAVLHRANKKPWVMVVEVDNLLRLLDVVDATRACPAGALRRRARLDSIAAQEGGGHTTAEPATENQQPTTVTPPRAPPQGGGQTPTTQQPRTVNPTTATEPREGAPHAMS